MSFRRATTTAAVAAVLLASVPATPARADGPAAGYRTCSLFGTIAHQSWVADAVGRYHPVTIRRPYRLTVVFPVH
ncbi:hypothetical protein [Amycolatopsis sp. Hca4]|uniref:hypothetical protein n=1 Tax=Amycolatopsis sp. Hca4 TaxID=2742131 RepID=UPI0020CB3120|nr:hypothetical protein [Amycolatopsis sp. Hca4]